MPTPPNQSSFRFQSSKFCFGFVKESNLIDFKATGGNPTGRYTIGRTIGDIVGEELGAPNYAVPFLAPNATGKTILNGLDYASGEGGILNAAGRIFVSTQIFF
ncbi:hypothetical protein Dsin_017224 [Dipteronia sinensis]|uniref:Uncharacterized protein n=1 Tax=Dipteronia sinensis TaxID=43782 RepID=A0AAE0AFJ2_9ROSI|nr:hypothetical protein Dsin_017224 [Dipteronia sinensis]